MSTLDKIFNQIDEKKKNIEFLKTGFKSLDKFLDGGFLRKELIVLGAFTGMGKSYVAGQIFYNIAKQGYNCGFFSLEISNEMIVTRLLGSVANIKPTKIMTNSVDEKDLDKLKIAKAELNSHSKAMRFYDDVYKYEELAKKIKKMNYDFVVVDFVQNVFHEGQEYERLSAIALKLQQLAKEQNVCIFILSQLSNSAAKTDVMEYKGSGSIATVCDLGFFLKREENATGQNQILLQLRKNRRGFSGQDFVLTFKQPGGAIYES